MTTFHRNSANPAGYDAFPSGYDFINNPSANGRSGAPAAFDGAKSGGPNDGTYFLGFGDDGTSAFYNRGLDALADNCDTLDNYLRRPLAIPTRTADVTAGGTVTSIVLPDASGVYLGSAGSSIPEAIATIYEITDSNDDEIINPATGAKCVVTAITGGTFGTGFSTGAVTLTVSPGIPSGKTYRVYYSHKGNLASMPTDTLACIRVHAAEAIPAELEDFMHQIAEFSGTTVTSLVATDIQTPDGIRLAKSGLLSIDVDPDASQSSRTFQVRFRRDSTPFVPFEVTTVLPSGITGAAGVVEKAANMVDYEAGTWMFSDANIIGAAPVGGVFAYAMTSASSSDGDNGLRVQGKLQVPGSGQDITPTLFRMVNGRWTCTCGDGVSSFGDYNGTGAILQAINHANSYGYASVFIHVKRGVHIISAPITIPNGMIVTLQGQGRGVTQLNTTLNSAAAIPTGTSVFLDLRDLTIRYGSGTCVTAVDFSQSNLDMTNVEAVGLAFTANKPAVFDDYNFVMRARSCSLNLASIYLPASFTETPVAAPLLSLTVAADTTTRGLHLAATSPVIFEDCFISSCDNQPMVQVIAPSGSGSGILEGIYLNRCDVFLGLATVTGGNLTGNSGLVDVVPNTSVSISVRELSLTNCRVRGGFDNTGSGTSSSILLHLLPVRNGDGTATNGFMTVQKVSIRGGRMEIPDVATNINPFTLYCGQLVLDGVEFKGSTSGNGAPTTDTEAVMNLLGYGVSPSATGDWAAFVFCVAGAAESRESLSIKSVNFYNFARISNSGDVLVFMPSGPGHIDGMTLSQYSDTGSGALPNHRCRIVGGGSGLNQSVAEGVSIIIPNSVASGHEFLNNAAISAYLVADSGLGPNGIILEKAFVFGPSVGGVQTAKPACTFTPHSSVISKVKLLGCEFTNCSIGIDLSGTTEFEDLDIDGCYIHGMANHGVFLQPSSHCINVAFRRNKIIGNGGTGITVNGPFATTDSLIIQQNIIKGNTASNQVVITSASTDLYGLFQGNDLGFNVGFVHVEESGGAYSSGNMPGLETSYAGGGSPSYTNGNSMMHNQGNLRTP